MKNEQIAQMVEALIKTADYDLWKNLYFIPDEPEACVILIDNLNALAAEHVNNITK